MLGVGVGVEVGVGVGAGLGQPETRVASFSRNGDHPRQRRRPKMKVRFLLRDCASVGAHVTSVGGINFARQLLVCDARVERGELIRVDCSRTLRT